MKHQPSGPATRNTPESVVALAAELGVEITNEQASCLAEHLSLVLSRNDTLNLTRITEYGEAVRLHVIDSLSCVPEVDGSPEGPYADVGAGAGFPGIPVAVATERESVLIESTGKKALFLEEAVEQLGLASRTKVWRGRAEALARVPEARFAVVTARAVSSLASLLELASPLLVDGGRLVALKGVPDEAELLDAERVSAIVGMRRVSVRRLSLPGGVESRTILVYEKTGEPAVSLPRAEGRAQRRPLG